MSEVVLEVKDLKTHFFTTQGVVRAVDGISFTLEKGRVLGIVGESGSGKSVTSLSILRLLPEPAGRIVGGEIRYRGQDLVQKTQKAMRQYRGRHLFMISQNPMTSLNPVYTIRNQMAEAIPGRKQLTRTELNRKIVEILKLVHIRDPKRRYGLYPHQFSGGMRQRVVIALALCANPRLIIADEPTTALDVSIQAQIIALLRRLCEDHDTAVMLVTHDMGVIAEIADRVAVMYAGRLVEVGPVRAVIKSPHHPYTVGLMGSIPMIGQTVDQLTQIDGAMPRLTEIPSGCAFHPRCRHTLERCRVERPELREQDDSIAACWLETAGG